MHYKEYSVHEVWLPPLNPNDSACQWMTDPKGIELFAAGASPPDPVSMHAKAPSPICDVR